MIPYNTDAPLYHPPIATVGLIVLNTILFFAVPSSLVQPDDISIDVAGLEGAFDGDQEIEEFDAAKWAADGEFDPTQLDIAISYPSNTLILEYGNGIKPWQWLTSIFMHGDFFHLLFNMIALWAFGLVVEGKVGPWVFLMLFLGIGVGQSGVEQTLMSFAGEGGSLGASAAIFGILGLAVVWAPRNDFDVLWSFGFYVGTIEIPIMVYGFISFAMEAVGIVFGRFGVSSGILHLMGLGIGIGLGFLWLRRDWVDCEGWDLINVLQGKEGSHEENAELDSEARNLVRTSLKSRREAAAGMPNSPPPPRTAPPMAAAPDVSDFGDLFTTLPQAASSASRQDVEQLITVGNYAVAFKLLMKLRQAGTAPELSQPMLNRLIRDLLAAKDFAAAAPLMSEHINRFSLGRVSLQLNLAKVLLHLERPKKAAEVLKSMRGSPLDETAKASWKKLAEHAKRQMDAGVIELDD